MALKLEKVQETSQKFTKVRNTFAFSRIWYHHASSPFIGLLQGRPVKVPSSRTLVAPAASRVSKRPRELLGNMFDPLGNSSSALEKTAA